MVNEERDTQPLEQEWFEDFSAKLAGLLAKQEKGMAAVVRCQDVLVAAQQELAEIETEVLSLEEELRKVSCKGEEKGIYEVPKEQEESEEAGGMGALLEEETRRR